ncbi:PhzF family phenazine biosynthesis protein [Fibrella arboris]|uniref:PhzF family phenazine biosynthesis protein n=1 Tax=Fibrella arboris TaxID=3242486 RepID=UPI0035215573
MSGIPYYIVDVFATEQYQGNQLAVFVDFDQRLSDGKMQQIAREINFAETTFIRTNQNNQQFGVRIFTPEHEVPFAGHPSLGTAYIIARFLVPNVPDRLVLQLAHADIPITIIDPNSLSDSILFMQQAQPEFRDLFNPDEVASELGIDPGQLDRALPIQEISTGLPYIIIPLKSLAALQTLSLTYDAFQAFLYKRKKYRTNSSTGHSTSLFFVTPETYEADNSFSTRMLLLENGHVAEDAATGSANGCLLAYLLLHQRQSVTATIEQGFQLGRPSYIYLKGDRQEGQYRILVGGRTQLIAEGKWYS